MSDHELQQPNGQATRSRRDAARPMSQALPMPLHYTRVAMLFHWTMALGILCLIVMVSQ